VPGNDLTFCLNLNLSDRAIKRTAISGFVFFPPILDMQ
jgi:hypothetical protein